MGDQRARAFTNRVFDAIVGIGPGVRWSSFRVCGVAGLLVGVVWALLLAQLNGKSPSVILLMMVAAVGSFLSLVVIRNSMVFQSSEVTAREILGFRGHPTLAVRVRIGETSATAGVSSGASTGAAEAVESCDHNPARYGGAGVTGVDGEGP